MKINYFKLNVEYINVFLILLDNESNPSLNFKEKTFIYKKLFLVIFLLLTILYISYHLYNGKYGFKAFLFKNDSVSQKKSSVKLEEREIMGLQNKIQKLQYNNFDSDLLDEEIRKNAGYAKEKEIVLYSKDL